MNEIFCVSSRPFPKLGITLDGIRHFIDINGGNSKLSGKTTTNIKDELLLPLLEKEGYLVSYCEFLKGNCGESTFTGKATLFVSHAWSYTFLDVIETLICLQEKTQETIYFWFDLFSNNQCLESKPPPFEWWCQTFSKAIASIGSFVMVIDKWDDPFTLTRSWCMWEVYCCFKTKTRFQVVMSNDQRTMMKQELVKDSRGFYQMLGNIDVRNCKASKPEDKIRIDEIVEKTVGFGVLNEGVMHVMKNWIISFFEEEAFCETGIESTFERLDLWYALTSLYEMQDRFPDALELSRLAVNVILHEKSQNTNATNPIVSHTLMRATTDESSLQQLPKVDASFLRWLHKICLRETEYRDALLKYTFEKSKALLGPCDQLTIELMLECGISELRAEGHQSLLLSALEKQKLIFGSSDINTLILMRNAGKAYLDRANYIKEESNLFLSAENILSETSSEFQRLLGASHPDSVISSTLLAKVYFAQERFTDAEAILAKTLNLTIEKLGDNTIRVSAIRQDLLKLYEYSHDYQKAHDQVLKIFHTLPFEEKIRLSKIFFFNLYLKTSFRLYASTVRPAYAETRDDCIDSYRDLYICSIAFSSVSQSHPDSEYFTMCNPLLLLDPMCCVSIGCICFPFVPLAWTSDKSTMYCHSVFATSTSMCRRNLFYCMLLDDLIRNFIVGGLIGSLYCVGGITISLASIPLACAICPIACACTCVAVPFSVICPAIFVLYEKYVKCPCEKVGNYGTKCWEYLYAPFASEPLFKSKLDTFRTLWMCRAGPSVRDYLEDFEPKEIADSRFSRDLLLKIASSLR